MFLKLLTLVALITLAACGHGEAGDPCSSDADCETLEQFFCGDTRIGGASLGKTCVAEPDCGQSGLTPGG